MVPSKTNSFHTVLVLDVYMGSRGDDSIVFVAYSCETLLDRGLAVLEDHRHRTRVLLPVDISPLELFEQCACAFTYDLAPAAVPVFVGQLVDASE